MADKSQVVMDVLIVRADTFQADVIDLSHRNPVVVDFWAPWCQPCRMLAPILEKLAKEYAGRLVIAKLNTEENLELAAALGISAIPTLMAFSKGKLVDYRVGVLSEDSLRQWFDSLLPDESEKLVARGKALGQADPARAEQLFRHALEISPRNQEAMLALAELALKQGRFEEVDQLLEPLTK